MYRRGPRPPKAGPLYTSNWTCSCYPLNDMVRERANRSHKVAVAAISMARLPRGTAIILQSRDPPLKTDVLIKAPTDDDYSLFARVFREEVTFADDPTTTGDAG